MAELIQTSTQGPVATVTLNRPELHNAFNEVMIQELQEAFTRLGEDSSVRVILLAAEGKSFCAGADLQWMKKMVDYSFDENVADARALSQMLKTIHDCPKPVIARVHGAAFGGGVGLVAACDMAVALKEAIFCLSEVKLGLLPAVISPFVLKKIGAAHAHRYFLTAEKFSAKQARKMALISATAEDAAELDETIQGLVDALLKNGPEAVSICKGMIEEVADFNWEKAMDTTAKLIAARRISAEGQEGMKAFLEKRSPAWIVETSNATR